MKTRINHLILFALFAFFSFTACQDEATEVDNPTDQETIVANSTLSSLMSRTTANFGAADDILDGASCFSVEFPVTIIVSDITIVIDSEDDLEELEDLLEELDDNEDLLDFLFPITIIFSDYTELVIENEDQLEELIDQCDDEEDNAIECIDFVYPISFSVFNSEFTLIETITIENDEALYEFLDDLEDDENALIVSLNYPVTLEYTNGETIEVTSNQELADAIEAAGDDCDDEDDECLEEEVALNLAECPWEVYLYSNNDFENLDGPYVFTFSEDGNMVIEGTGNDPYTTTWELSETDNGLELNIALFYYYEAQFGNWLVVECDDDDLELEHLTIDDTGLFFEQNCEDDLDCSITDISSILQECPWDFTDGTDIYNNYQLVFNGNGDLLIPEGFAASAIGGSWELSLSDTGFPEIVISNLTAFLDDLEGSWIIIECDEEGELSIIRGNDVLELDQDCEGDLGCSVEDISTSIIECAWMLQTNLIDSVVPIYVYFTPNGQILSSNDDIPESQIGTWEIVTVASGVYIEFTFQQGFEVLNGQWQVVECTEDELYLVSGNNYISLDQDCDLNNQDLLECYSLYVDSQECDANNDGIATFIFETNSNQAQECLDLYPLVLTTHPTYQDAENNTSLLNIQLTTPIDLESQTIYVRVYSEVSMQYAIQELQIEVESCNDDVFNCFGDFEIVECNQPNNVPVYNLSASTIGLVDCPENFIASFHATLMDAESNSNAIENTEAYGTLVSQVYLRIEADSGNFEIFNIYLNTIDCNLFECFESFDAQIEICDNGTDGPYTFDLTIAFANCTPSVDVVTYYETQVDAEIAVNEIANPEAYTNVAVEQTIYVRVEINNQFEVFPIQLIIVNCEETCSEEDVDAFLLECIWNAVNYNGSDNLMEWNFDFESTSQIVVIYTNDATIDAIWTTSQSADGVIVTFANVAGSNIQAITGEWLVVECEEERLELHRGEDVLILERNCN